MVRTLYEKYGLTPEFIKSQKDISKVLYGGKKTKNGPRKKDRYMGKVVKDAYVGVYADNFETYMSIQNFSMFCNIALKHASAIMATEVNAHMMGLGPLDRPSQLLVEAFNELHPLRVESKNRFLAKRQKEHERMLKEINGEASKA